MESGKARLLLTPQPFGGRALSRRSSRQGGVGHAASGSPFSPVRQLQPSRGFHAASSRSVIPVLAGRRRSPDHAARARGLSLAQDAGGSRGLRPALLAGARPVPRDSAQRGAGAMGRAATGREGALERSPGRPPAGLPAQRRARRGVPEPVRRRNLAGVDLPAGVPGPLSHDAGLPRRRRPSGPALALRGYAESRLA